MGPRGSARIAVRKAETRRRILAAARRLVAESGFAGLQIAAVAGGAGVATGSVYRYFPSKAELALEVYRSACDREVQVAEEIAQGAGSVTQRLEAALQASASRAVRAGRTAYALIAEPVDPLLDAERLVYRRLLARVFEGLIAEGLESGCLAEQDASASAACIVGSIMEAVAAPLAPGADAGGDPQRRLGEVVAFCRRAVGAAA